MDKPTILQHIYEHLRQQLGIFNVKLDYPEIKIGSCFQPNVDATIKLVGFTLDQMDTNNELHWIIRNFNYAFPYISVYLKSRDKLFDDLKRDERDALFLTDIVIHYGRIF